MITDSVDERHKSPIRRLTDGGRRWLVMVETWCDSGMFHGRLLFRQDAIALFRPDVVHWHVGERSSPPILHGASREDVLALAHDLPEERLRRVLYSLG